MTETASPPEAFGWPSAEFTACPYPFYRRLQEDAPVCHIPGTRTYLISRWTDIAQVAQNSDVFQQPALFPELEPRFEVDFATVDRYTRQATVTTNGPEHKVKRAWGLRLVDRARLRSYEPLIAGIANELIDLFIDKGHCEFRGAFAEQLPAYVMMDLLGLPRDDAGMFMAGEFVAHQAEELVDTSYGYALRAIRTRLETKTDDFISEILWDQVSRDGAVDINYQVAQLINLIGAGSETTAHLLANTMLLLCRHPPVLDRVRADRSLLRPLIEESMRLETPVQWLPRLARAKAVVGGVEIPAGATVWLLWAAGNRDPDKWEAPEELRIDRPSLAQNQLGFGRGPHLCLGAPLARLESVIAFDRILTRLDNLEVLEEQSDLTNVMKSPPSGLEGIYDASGSMHGPKTLVVAFHRAL